MNLKLKPEFLEDKIHQRPHQPRKQQADEIERQIQECINACLIIYYMDGDYSKPCRPWFLVALPRFSAKWLVMGYGELIKKKLKHSRSIPQLESTPEKNASCRYKTYLNKRILFWPVDLMPNAQELLALITPEGRVFKWKVMPFGVANAPARMQQLVNKILFILHSMPVVEELIFQGAEMRAHINYASLGTNAQEDYVILPSGCMDVCRQNNPRVKLEKYEFKKNRKGRAIGYNGHNYLPQCIEIQAKRMNLKIITHSAQCRQQIILRQMWQ